MGVYTFGWTKLDVSSGRPSGQRTRKRPAGSGRAPPGPPPAAALRQPRLLLWWASDGWRRAQKTESGDQAHELRSWWRGSGEGDAAVCLLTFLLGWTSQADSLRDDLRSVAKFVADTYGEGGAQADSAQVAIQQFATYVTSVDGALFQAKRSDTLSDETGEQSGALCNPTNLDVSSGRRSGRRARKRPAGSGRAPPGPPPAAALRQPHLLLLAPSRVSPREIVSIEGWIWGAPIECRWKWKAAGWARVWFIWGCGVVHD